MLKLMVYAIEKDKIKYWMSETKITNYETIQRAYLVI